jgi:hypothetical protein
MLQGGAAMLQGRRTDATRRGGDDAGKTPMLQVGAAVLPTGVEDAATVLFYWYKWYVFLLL